MSLPQRIADFNARLVVPLFEEIRTSARMAAKNRNLGYVQGLSTGEPTFDAAFEMLHGARKSLRDLPKTQDPAGEWVGHTLIMLEDPAIRSRHDHPQAGIYYCSVIFRLPGDGRVFVSPFVFFWMLFDRKMHGFAHRYDDALADHPIEAVSRAQMLSHALGSISFFDMHAFSPNRPF